MAKTIVVYGATMAGVAAAAKAAKNAPSATIHLIVPDQMCIRDSRQTDRAGLFG